MHKATQCAQIFVSAEMRRPQIAKDVVVYFVVAKIKGSTSAVSAQTTTRIEFTAVGSVIAVPVATFSTFPHCLLTYSYKGYAGRVDICCSINIKATIKASRVITVTAIAGNSY